MSLPGLHADFDGRSFWSSIDHLQLNALHWKQNKGLATSLRPHIGITCHHNLVKTADSWEHRLLVVQHKWRPKAHCKRAWSSACVLPLHAHVVPSNALAGDACLASASAGVMPTNQADALLLDHHSFYPWVSAYAVSPGQILNCALPPWRSLLLNQPCLISWSCRQIRSILTIMSKLVSMSCCELDCEATFIAWESRDPLQEGGQTENALCTTVTIVSECIFIPYCQHVSTQLQSLVAFDRPSGRAIWLALCAEGWMADVYMSLYYLHKRFK